MLVLGTVENAILRFSAAGAKRKIHLPPPRPDAPLPAKRALRRMRRQGRLRNALQCILELVGYPNGDRKKEGNAVMLTYAKAKKLLSPGDVVYTVQGGAAYGAQGNEAVCRQPGYS